MLYGIKDKIKREWFNFCCKGILSTRPVEIKRNNDLLVLSQVSHLDLLMYLIAIKSFYLQLKDAEVLVINDGTLTPNDISILGYHLPGLKIVNIKEININKCPQGGTWERHLLISELVRDYYIIQLDSDTVTIEDITEVKKLIKENRSFAIGNKPNQQIQTMKATCEEFKSWKDDKWTKDNVEVISVRNFDKLNNYNQLKYSKCSSSFAGFAKKSFFRCQVEEFSENMEKIIGTKWREWGSEQVTSNFIISNAPDSCVLPYPKYASYFPNRNSAFENCFFLHFIGLNRFKNGFYIKMANNAIKKLN